MDTPMGKFHVKYQAKEYEISKFLRNHPGGINYLERFNRKTIDSQFVQEQHSKAAKYLLREYHGGGRDISITEDHCEDLEHLVDWNKPMLMQVGKLGEKYSKWVFSPVDRTLKLFENDLLENLTKTPWYFVPLAWVPIIVYFFYCGVIKQIQFTDQFGFIHTIFIFAQFSLGIINWTLIEYTLHRYLFHINPSGQSKFLIFLHFALHGLHHKVPFDTSRLVFPPIPAALIAFIIYKMYALIIPAKTMEIFAAGTMTGYLLYDMSHYYLHAGTPKEGTYLYKLKRYHNQHHFSHLNIGFGVSNTYWDAIFGTLISLRKLTYAIKWSR